MKKIILVFAFLLVIGAGAFLLQSDTPEPSQNSPENPEQQNTKNIEISGSLARSLVASVLQSTSFSPQSATYKIADLDNLNGEELLIGATESISDFSTQPSRATIIAIQPLAAEGQYATLGTITYQEHLRSIPEIQEVKDLTGDDTKEILVSLGFGGASNEAYGLLQIDAQNKALSWVKLQDEAGTTREAIFLKGGTVTHTEDAETFDINNDGMQEIVEIFTQIWEPVEEEKNIPHKQEGEQWCLVRVYQWSGSLFIFSFELSEQLLSNLDSSCRLSEL